MKTLDSQPTTDWRAFGSRFRDCTIGRLAISKVELSMDAIAELMQSPEYRKEFQKYLAGIEKEYAWH